MVLVLAGIRLPDSYGGITAARYGFGLVKAGAVLARDTALFAFELPSRVNALLDEVSAVLARINAVVDEAERVVEQAGHTARSAGEVVDDAADTTRSAEGVIVSASRASDSALALIELFRPMAEKSAPFAQKFIDHLEEAEIDAAIAMVDELPTLVRHMDAIIPILATMESVAPEIHELLGVTKDVRRAVIGIPGFRYFRNRGRVKLEDEEGPD